MEGQIINLQIQKQLLYMYYTASLNRKNLFYKETFITKLTNSMDADPAPASPVLSAPGGALL